MKRWTLFPPAFLLLAMMLACTSNTPVTTSSPSAKSPTTAPAATKPLATTAPTQSQRTPVISADGRLAYVQDVKLAFGTSGKISHIDVNEQDKVIKGKILARLDTVTLEQAVKTAEYAATAAELAVKSAQADRAVAENAIKTAETDLKTAQQNANSAGIDLEQATDNFRKITYPYDYVTTVFDVPQAIGYMHDASLQIAEASAKLKSGTISDSDLDAIRTLLRNADENLTRGSDLLRRGSGNDVFQSQTLPMRDFWTLRAAQLAMEKAKVSLDNAQNNVAKAGITLDNNKWALNKAQIAVDKANNDFDKAKTELAKAKDELQKATITSPIEGVVAKIYLKELDVLTTSNYATTTVIEVIDPGKMQLDVKVNELDIGNIKLGQKAIILVESQANNRLNSTVAEISLLPVIESGVVSYEVTVVIDVPPGSSLRAGMRASVQISQ